MSIKSEDCQAFDSLVRSVQACTACARMGDSVRVLSWANGNPNAPLMFVGEAPGRLGADRTAIPFHGDKSGDNFERLLELAGVARANVFVTNAVLCNPRDSKGNNAPPSKEEVGRCALHLKSQIELINPRMVMTLGAVALEATRHIEHHDLVLRNGVRTSNQWFGRLLLPLYHPGARAMIHRSFANQTADYYFVGETFRRLDKSRRRATPVRGSVEDWEVVRELLKAAGRLGYFRLHKLMYLVDQRSLERLGRRATGFLYLRQKDGPYCVELGSRWHQRFGDQVAFDMRQGAPIYHWRPETLFDVASNVQIDQGVREIVDDVVRAASRLSDAQLKTKAYLTAPMREILKAEKAGSKMLNRPLLHESG